MLHACVKSTHLRICHGAFISRILMPNLRTSLPSFWLFCLPTAPCNGMTRVGVVRSRCIPACLPLLPDLTLPLLAILLFFIMISRALYPCRAHPRSVLLFARFHNIRSARFKLSIIGFLVSCPFDLCTQTQCSVDVSSHNIICLSY